MALRWRYIQEISLYVDEYVTAWAARSVLARGLPIFPSGNFYAHGLLFTYLEAPFVLGEFDETVARIPGLIVSLAMLPVAYWVGRKLFSERLGLVVAAALAVDPDCILWGGRARMYGLLQLLTLLAIYVYYRGLVDDRPRDRYLAMILVALAVFTHLEAALLLPALGLATLVILPWRRALRWNVVLPFAIAAVSILTYMLISKFGQPGHLETLQESRPYLDLSGDVLSGPMVFAPVFTGLHRLPFAILTVAGLYFLFRPRFDRLAPLTYLYVIFAAVLIPLLVLAGPTWQNERYLFMLLPILFAMGGQALADLLDLWPVVKRALAWQPAGLALATALFVGLTGSPAAYAQEWGYDLAFRYLRDRWEPAAGDRVATISPSACALYLEECDYFAIQRGYEEFIVSRPVDGLPADLWTATPVLTETTDFVDLLAVAPRVWLVTDGWRFQTRYEASFIQTVLDQMVLEYDERGVMVFRGEGLSSLAEPPILRDRKADFAGQVALNGFGLSSADPSPGDQVEITLYWEAMEGAGTAYTAFLHLLAPDGRGVGGIDESMLRGLYQPALWPEGVTFADRHQLTVPADLAPGRYRLDVGLYPQDQPETLLPVGGGDRLPLAMLTVGEVAVSPPSSTVSVDFGRQIRLLGYDLQGSVGEAPGRLNITLHWQCLVPVARDYTVFAHLVSPDGTIVTQDDGPPGDPFFPTSTWLPGTAVLDSRSLVLPAGAVAGEYALLIGLYYQPTEERLEVTGADGEPMGDAFRLAPISIGARSP